MALEIFKLFGSIMVNNEDANKSISKTDEKAEGLGKKFLSGVGTAAKWGAGIAAAAGAGATAMFGMAQKSSETADRIDKLSNKIGISKQGFQEWDYIMGQNGMDVEKLQVGVKTLVTQMDAAAGGSKTAGEAFSKLGLSWEDGNGNLKNQEQMMNESILALANMENGTEKARLATQLFGKAGTEMMPMLNNGAEGIEELKNRAHDLGLVIGDDAVDAGVKFGDTLDDVKASFGMVATKIGVQVMPIIQKLMDFLLNHMPEIQSVLSVVFRVIEFFVSSIIGWIGNIVEVIGDKFGWIIDKVIQMKDTFISSMEEFDDYGEAFKNMLEVLFEPIGDLPIFEEIGTLISAVQEIIARIQGGEGIAEAFRNAFSWRDSVVGNSLLELMDFMKGIFEAIELVIITVVENLAPIFEGLKTLFMIFMDYLRVAWESVGKPVFEFFLQIVQKLAEVFSVVFPILVSIFQGLCDTLGLLWENILKPIFQSIGWLLQNFLLPTFSAVFSVIANVVMVAFQFIGDLWNNSLKPILDGIILFIGGIFKGNWSQVWDGIKSILSGIWGGLKTILWAPIDWFIGLISPIADKIVAPFKTASEAIGRVWEAIKGVFKLPHFTIDGTLDPRKWKEEGMPHIGVEWYYKGGIFNGPTVLPGGIGVGDRFNGKGGKKEAVVPLDEMYAKIKEIIDEKGDDDKCTPIQLYIEHFENNRREDIEELAEELAFYFGRKDIIPT